MAVANLCRYWWLKLRSLAEKEEWEELEKFSKSKKSPIGYLVKPCTISIIHSAIGSILRGS